MQHKSKRVSWVEDCLLAAFTSAIACALTIALAGSFSWPAVLSLLILPTVLLSNYARYRAAGIAATLALLGGIWVVIPPRWSFQIDVDGVFAILTFLSAAMLAITLAARAAERKATPPPTASNA